MSMYKLIRAILKQLKTKRFGMEVAGIEDNGTKIKFEKGILELLKKFGLNNKKMAIQKIEIVASVESRPEVKIEYILMDKP